MGIPKNPEGKGKGNGEGERRKGGKGGRRWEGDEKEERRKGGKVERRKGKVEQVQCECRVVRL